MERGSRLKVLSLFSGIGAFEKAMDNLDIAWELVGYSEIDNAASRVYSAVHGVPESLNLGDITKIDETALPKDIDLITYGFPCQDISVQGSMTGLFNSDGSRTRSGLFFDALRIIQATRPRYAIAENVKNLLSPRFEEQFAAIIDGLDAAGYNSYWRVLNAKDSGVPQNRERVFIVSIRKGDDPGNFRFAPDLRSLERLEDILENETEVRIDGLRLSCPYTDTAVAAAYRGRYVDGGRTAQRLEVSDREYANALTGVKKDSMVALHGECRYFTELERFRLMGFEDSDYYKAAMVATKTQLVKQTGNSIVVPVAERVLDSLPLPLREGA